MPQSKDTIRRITAREWAVMKQIWQLSETEKQLLDADGYFMRRTRAAYLAQTINDNHDFKDFLYYRGHHYEVQYIDCSLPMICEDMDAMHLLLLSFRHNKAANLFICIVKNPSSKIDQHDLISKYQEI